jgi:hypothetical protein
MSLIWTQAALEPKRKFKYLLNISNPILKDFEFLAQTCDRPGIKVGASEHKYFDKTYYHPGRVTWDPNPLSVKLVDIQKREPSGVDTNGQLLKAFAASGLSGLIGIDGAVTTLSKEKATNALDKVTIRVLNADKAIAEEWTLMNAWLESFKPDALDYGAEDILTVTMTIRYDWAEFKDATETQTGNKFGPAGGAGGPTAPPAP